MNLKVISYYCDVDDSKYYEKSYHRLKDETVIEMGLSDVESKKDSLRKMGFDESKIEWQSVGLNNE